MKKVFFNMMFLLLFITSAAHAELMGGVINSDGAQRPLRLDSSTHSAQIVDYEHHEIHSGSHYFVAGQETEASAATIEFIVVTPDSTSWSHMTFEIVGSGDTTFAIYEGASGITGGSSTTPLNNNRNSANTSGLTLTKDPTSITSDGTLIYEQRVGSNRQAGLLGRGQEIILKQDETYLFRVTSNAASNNISYKAEWYEHTDKN